MHRFREIFYIGKKQKQKMMRRLIKQGATSLVVSLPIEWIRSQKLRIGDEVEIQSSNDRVVIHPKKETKLRQYELKTEGLDELALYIHLLNLYRRGYDEVKIVSTTGKIIDYETEKAISNHKSIKKWLPRFIGWEIITQEPLLIKDITGVSSDDPEQLLQRVFFLLNTFVDEQVAVLDTKNTLPDPAEFYTMTFKLINYAIRTYNKRSEISHKLVFLQQLHAIAQHLRDIQPFLKSEKKIILPILLLLRPTLKLYNTGEISPVIRQHYLAGLSLSKTKIDGTLLKMLLQLHRLLLDTLYSINYLHLEKKFVD